MVSFKKKVLLTGIFSMFVGSASALTIGGLEMSESDLQTLFTSEEIQSGKTLTLEEKKELKNQFITIEVLKQAALKKKLDQSPEFIESKAALAKAYTSNPDLLKLPKKSQALMNSAQLASLYLRDYQSTILPEQPSANDLNAAYQSARLAASNPTAYLVQHILIRTQAEAQKLLAYLKKGAAFGELAVLYSIDPSAKENRGDLGWVSSPESAFVPEFSAALLQLKKGMYSEPVQSQFGWHLIYLADTRPASNEEKSAAAAKNTTYQMRLAIFNSEKEALMAADKVRKGLRFEQMAKATSVDTQAKQSGGLLPPVRASNLEQLTDPLAMAIKAAPVGQLHLTPIKHEDNWFLFLVEKKDPFITLNEFKTDYQQTYIKKQEASLTRKIEAHIAELRAAAHVVE
ncbi:MAG: peptidylprolyl isomerase [Neisseriaceae bacterium]|nr:peptidylprolyl isomerase [Neisseriaceae bacterium]